MTEWRYDEWGHLINDFGCIHDGAPCNWCVSNPGEPRPAMFFPVEDDNEDS